MYLIWLKIDSHSADLAYLGSITNYTYLFVVQASPHRFSKINFNIILSCMANTRCTRLSESSRTVIVVTALVK
jgi:hypothetical protein